MEGGDLRVSCKLCLDCIGKIGSFDLVCHVRFPSWILLDLSCCLFFDSPRALPEVSSISGGFCFPFGFCAEAAAAAREFPHRQSVVRPALISSACAWYFSRGWFFGCRSVRSSHRLRLQVCLLLEPTEVPPRAQLFPSLVLLCAAGHIHLTGFFLAHVRFL
jgi:hypothetical protein